MSPNQSRTNIDVSPYLDTFVDFFSKLHAHDNSDSGEHVANTHVNGDNVATSHILFDD